MTAKNKGKWRSHLTEIDVDPNRFLPKAELSPKLWNLERLDPEIRSKLLKIADEFLNSFSVELVFEDITLTGSLASYYWHENSDVDLHIIVDFDKIDESEEILKELCNSKRFQWNKSHEILIHGHEVEIYVQDIKEEHHNLGQFSLFYNKWTKNPEKDVTEIDFDTVEKKADQFAEEIDEVKRLNDSGEYKESYNLAKRVAKKLKKARSSALDQGGALSVDNLVFKALRNAGYLGKLMSLKVVNYDKMMSISERKDNSLNFNKKWKHFLNV